MQSRIFRTALLALAGAVSGLAGPVYLPVVLSSTGGTVNGIPVNANHAYGYAALAPGGNVVFASQFLNGPGNHIFTVINGVITTADPLGSGAGVSYFDAFINGSGQIAYSSIYGGAYIGGTLAASGSTHGLGFNDSGTLLWNQQDGLHKQSGLVATGNGGTGEMDGSGGVLYITNDGTNRLFSGSGNVVVGPGSVIGGTAVVGVADSFGFNRFALSANGNLAVYALDPSFNATIVTTLGQRITNPRAISGLDINDNGTLAVSSNGTIFTQYGTVVGVGDVINGKTLNAVSAAGSHFLDNNGDILASVAFGDGSGALVLFVNTSAPEPSSWALFAGAAAVWIGWRRKALVPRQGTRERTLPGLSAGMGYLDVLDPH